MNAYGYVAVYSTMLCQEKETYSPPQAWEVAVENCLAKDSMKRNGCPRNAFLGLCEEGFVQGIPPGKYTRSMQSKKYAIDAAILLSENPEYLYKRKKFWEVISNGCKIDNRQLDVVIELYKCKLLNVKYVSKNDWYYDTFRTLNPAESIRNALYQDLPNEFEDPFAELYR